MGKNIASCAQCNEFTDPKKCKKVDNLVAKLFAMIFKSDRPACIAQIKSIGLEGHAKKMAELKAHSLKK